MSDVELKVRLTGRELEILEMLSKGMRNKEIANILGLSCGTVKFHVQNVYTKLSATNRTEAVANAFRCGVIT
jgi:DNA-binding NarL/FixJ family response regulator